MQSNKPLGILNKIVDGVGNAVEQVAMFSGSIFKSHAASFVMLETAENETVMVCSDGSLFSGIRLNGYMACMGDPEFYNVISTLSNSLKTFMQEPGHVIQFWFGTDPDFTKTELTDRLRASIATSKSMGLDAQDLNDSKIEYLDRFTSSESLYVGIWTTSSVMSKEDSRFEKARRKDANFPRTPITGQALFAGVQGLHQSHEAIMTNIMRDLGSVGIAAELLSCREVCYAARMSVAHTITNPDWKPILPGDKVPRRMRKDIDAIEFEDLGYPPIYSQVVPYDAIKLNGSLVEVGDIVYAPMFIEIPADEPKRFSDLFARMAEFKIPWRYSMIIEGGGINTLAMKGELAGLFQWASSHNKQIHRAYKELKEISLNEPIVRVKMSFCTWAPKGDLKVIRSRAAQLSKCISGWGRCEVRDVSGDPMAGFISSACFISRNSIATAAYGPVDEIVTMAPIDRPASPWRNGSVIFRTIDGKMMPFEPGSSMQTTWNYIGFGSPGYGKSVMASTILMAACQQPGIKRLPRIAITDIGPSSAGFIDAVKDMLPASQKHLATRFRMRMTDEFAINPCDTHLGLDYPLPDDKSFLVSLITLLATPPESGESYDSMSSLVSKIIDIMYDQVSRAKNPKVYRPGINNDIDEALRKYDITTNEDTTWWGLVDTFFERNLIHYAYIAQRYAVPTISDAISAAHDSTIRDLYSDPKIRTTESLVGAFSRLIQESMRDYPILSRPTVFDIGDARIVSMDIDEVAPRGTPSADKQTAVMYMLSSFMMTRDWRLSNDSKLISSLPDKYRAYHEKRIIEIHEDMKWDVADEFHRASKVAAAAPVIADYVVRMREGRKWNRGILLLSQSIGDYPKEILEFISGVFVLEAGTTENAEKLQSIFGFNDTAKQLLLSHANGPMAGGGGSPFLGIFKTKSKTKDKSGMFAQLLVNTISPIEVWSFSTTSEDRLIREGVFARLGQKRGRYALARCFPGGSAKNEVERLRLKFADASREEKELGAIQIVINDVVKQAMEWDKEAA